MRSVCQVTPQLTGPASVGRSALMQSSPRSSPLVDLGRLSRLMRACLGKRSTAKVSTVNNNLIYNYIEIYLVSPQANVTIQASGSLGESREALESVS